jgi:hypothetical protein
MNGAMTRAMFTAAIALISSTAAAISPSVTFASLAPSASPSSAPKAPAKSWDRPRLYLQIADESQRDLAIKLRKRLQKFGYTVMTIQNVSGNEGIPTQSSELRFFTPSDSVEAQRIAKEIAPFFRSGGIITDLPEGMPYVSHARQYEIWFSTAFHAQGQQRTNESGGADLAAIGARFIAALKEFAATAPDCPVFD